jgi:predicted acetyltransferase
MSSTSSWPAKAAISATACCPNTGGGYATEILRQSLIIARANGVDRVLMYCDEDNAGSRAVIESCGGKLDCVTAIAAQPTPICRYWID